MKPASIPEIASGRYSVKSRSNGFQWAIDPNVERSDLDCVDHEDWIYDYLTTPPGGVFVDVGAFVGTHAIRVAKQCECRVIAFEPVAAHQALIRVNQQLNDTSIELIPKAVGQIDGTIGFRADGPAESQVTLDASRINCEVPIAMIDTELKILERMDVMLIDVEGLEVEVLGGATHTLRRLRPRIIVEIHSHLSGRSHNGNQIEAWCAANDYHGRRIWENTPSYYYVELTPVGEREASASWSVLPGG